MRLFASTVADRPVHRMTARRAVGLIRIAHGAPNRHVLVDQVVAGLLIRVITHPEVEKYLLIHTSFTISSTKTDRSPVY